MSKVKVSISLEVPPDFIVFDIGASKFVCKGCLATEEWDLDEGATRGGGPSDKARIKRFLGAHGSCVAARAKGQLNLCSSPAPSGFECKKPKGHQGPCDQ